MNIVGLLVGCSAGVVLGIALAGVPSAQGAVVQAEAFTRPSMVLCQPDHIDNTEIGESWFTVDFDRLPGSPGSQRQMRVNWYSEPGVNGSWAVLIGADDITPIACLPAFPGANSTVVNYVKPAGVQVIKLTAQPSYCPGNETYGQVSAITIELL